jgi:hypothetical protein
MNTYKNLKALFNKTEAAPQPAELVEQGFITVDVVRPDEKIA